MTLFIIAVVLVVCVVIAICALLIVSFWKIFTKAQRPGWSALIPFYNFVKLLEITNEPPWWIVLLVFVPIVNIVLTIILYRRVAAVFGKGAWFTVGLLLLPFIFFPILAFGKSQYVNTYPPSKEMSEAVKWTLIAWGLFAVAESLYLIVIVFAFGTPRPAPLTIISSEFGYATDGNYVYMNDMPIYGADPSTFRVEGDYAVDSRSVYYEGDALNNVEPSTFTVLSSGSYAEDGDSGTVYYDNSPIQGADASTFVDVGQGYAKDANNVYFDGGVVEGADPATFVLDADSNENFDAKDSSHYYLEGDVVTK